MSTDQEIPAGKRSRRGPRYRRPRTPDDRLATWLRRLRWPAVICWLIAIVALNPLSGSLSKVTNDTASAYLPASAASTRVAEMQEAATGSGTKDSLIVVFARSGGALTQGDLAVARAARSDVAGLTGHVAGLAPPGALQPSSDGKAVLFATSVTSARSGAADRDAVKAVRAAVSSAVSSAGPAASAGLTSAVTGDAAVTADSSSGNQQTILLLTALIIVAIILLVVYRSPVLWLLPLIGSIGAIVVAQASAHGLVNGGLTVSTLSADILIVLVFGAASDYALLLVHRYREELRHHACPEAAMAVTLRRTLPTLIASAATVTCAMLCLLAADSASLHGLGPVGAVGIVAALLAQVTLLPALLLLFGRAAFWPRIPRHGAAGREESRVWAGIGARVARRPALTAVVMIVALGAACAGLASLRFANDPVDNVKGNPGSVVGGQLIDAHFPAGSLAPLTLLAPPSEAGRAVAAARSVPGTGSVTPSGSLSGYSSYQVILSVGPYSPDGTTALVNLRSRLDASAPGSLVGGNPAIQYDGAQAAGRDAAVIIPLVLAVILVVIGLLLRAVIAPLVLVMTTALSFAASFGLSSLLWHGLGYTGVQSVIPIYIFIFLVALGVDYNIFLSARIREESRSAGPRAATLRGLGVTGGVITAAGIVLAGTFLALTQIPQVNIAEVGTAVALGVLLDTLLVRTVLVPASFLTLGERVWWPARPAGAQRTLE